VGDLLELMLCIMSVFGHKSVDGAPDVDVA